MTNSSQSVTASLTLSAFGQTIASSGSSSSPYQFGAMSGYRSEGDAGLTLVGCRFYDAQMGRFITRDTYLNQAPYAYCDGDPVNRLDASGHSWLGFGAGLATFALVTAIIAVGVILTVGTGGLAAPIIAIGGGFVAGACGGAVRGTVDGDDVPTDMAQDGITGAVGGGLFLGGGKVAAIAAKALEE